MFKALFKEFKKKPIKTWVLFIIFISFIAKLIMGYTVRESFFRRGNSHTPLNAIAFNIKDNWEYAIEPGIPSVDYEPIYPMILGLSYKVFGTNWFGVTLIQAILYGITSWLLFLIGINVKDEMTGFIAAAYHSFYPYLFFHSLSVFDTTQFVFIVISLLYVVLFIKVKGKERHWNYVVIGALLGFSLLSRGSAIALWPPIILYLLFTRSGFVIFKKLGIVIITLLFVLVPWLARNFIHTNSVLISTHGGFGFWQGNNEFSYYYLKNDISLDEVYRRNPAPEIYQEFPIMARPPNEAVIVAQVYASEAVQFIKKNPKTFLKLCGLKFIRFWSWIRTPVRSEYEYGSKNLRQLIYFISYIPLLIFLPVGSYLVFKNSFKIFLLLFGMVITYTIAHMIVMGFTRTRLPIDPILMLLFAIGASSLFGYFKSRW